MSPQEWLAMVVDTTVVIAFVGLLYTGLKKWIRQTASPAQIAADRLKTTNGHTVGQIVEDTAVKLDTLTDKVDKLNDTVATNKSLIELAHRRIDVHLKEDHGTSTP